MGGLGFNGFDENGVAKWDRLTIVNVLRLEVLQYNITLCNFLHVHHHHHHHLLAFLLQQILQDTAGC